MPSMSRILNDAILLGGGLFLYSMIVFGAPQHFFHKATALGALILVLTGFWIHRRFWRTASVAAAVAGAALLILLLGITLMALTSSEPVTVGKAFSVAFATCLTVYVPFFWLPFVFGVALAGFHSRRFKTPPSP